jgi:hypothetical protein
MKTSKLSIPCPFKKGFKVQNRTNAIQFLIDRVFLFDQVLHVQPNLLLVNEKVYRVHAYCDSSKAMIATPHDANNSVALSTFPVLMVSKPIGENRIIVYELTNPGKIASVTDEYSVEWEVIRKLADRTFVIDLETGGMNEYLSKV